MAALVSLHPIKRTRSTSLASLPQEATKNMEVYKIIGSPKRKGYWPKQRRINLLSTSLTLPIKYFTSFFNSRLVYSTFSSICCHLYHVQDMALGVYVYHQHLKHIMNIISSTFVLQSLTQLSYSCCTLLGIHALMRLQE